MSLMHGQKQSIPHSLFTLYLERQDFSLPRFTLLPHMSLMTSCLDWARILGSTQESRQMTRHHRHSQNPQLTRLVEIRRA